MINRKKFIIAIFCLLIGIIILSLFERKTGSANFTSDPAGAEIWIDGSNTGKVTPNTINNLKDGKHSYSLKKDGIELFNGTLYIKDNTVYGSKPVNGLDDDVHAHICDDCHIANFSIYNIANISNSRSNFSFGNENDLVCHKIIIGEHSMGKDCEYCHTNSTQFTPHTGGGICLDCHGD